MTVIELLRAVVHDAPIGVVVTDARLDPPGPTILYANAAFGRLTGRDPQAVLGLSPRFMQGRETRRTALDAFRLRLAAGERFHGYLTNYRPDGARYRVEIDCRPLRAANGQTEHFIAFEREVIRRVGRPAAGAAGRYEPASVSNLALTGLFRELQVFTGP